MLKELKHVAEAMYALPLVFFGRSRKPAPEPINVVPSSEENAENITSDEVKYVDRKGNITKIPKGTQEIHVEFVAMADVGTPLHELMEKLDQMQTITEVKSIDDMEKPSQAQAFVEKIKEDHRIPDLKDTKLARELNVLSFGYYWNAQGYYKLSWIDFEDQSSWERGKAYA